MLVSIVLLVLLCEFVGMRKGRFKTLANPASQGVSYVSYVRPTNNIIHLIAGRNHRPTVTYAPHKQLTRDRGFTSPRLQPLDSQGFLIPIPLRRDD